MKTCISITALFLLTLCCGTTTAARAGGYVRKQAMTTEEELMPKMKAALEHGNGNGNGELSFDELGITDERDAQALCTTILNTVDVLPDFMDCSCSVQFLRLRISFACSTPEDLCLPDDFSSLPPLAGLCVEPNYKGVLGFDGSLASEVCNEPMVLNFSYLFLDYALALPRVCATATHQQGAVTKLEECEFNIGDESCSCTVCEGGQEVTLDCTDATVLEILAPLATFECIGLGLIGGARDENGQLPLFLSPLLTLPALLAANGGDGGV
jgi:hypothetical protein